MIPGVPRFPWFVCGSPRDVLSERLIAAQAAGSRKEIAGCLPTARAESTSLASTLILSFENRHSHL